MKKLLVLVVCVIASLSIIYSVTRVFKDNKKSESAIISESLIQNVDVPSEIIQPTSCETTYYKDDIPIPVITRISPDSIRVGQKLTVSGCHLNGFEGDKGIILVNSEGELGYIKAPMDDITTSFSVVIPDKTCTGDTSYSGLPCNKWLEIKPGVYDVYVDAWSSSNKLKLTVR